MIADPKAELLPAHSENPLLAVMGKQVNSEDTPKAIAGVYWKTILLP